MKISDEITYGDITKKAFTEFLQVLKKVDPKEYATEAKDDFLDLYNYWKGAGLGRFNFKLIGNRAKL